MLFRMSEIKKALFLFLTLLCLLMTTAKLTHFKMESHIPREGFVQQARSLETDLHEIVFAVKQKNLDVLESKLMDSSTPGSPKYQQWLTFEEVGDISSNLEGATRVKEWLAENEATVSWTSKHHDYIKATATISTWERLLDTTFYQWQDLSKRSHSVLSVSKRTVHRALEYSLPLEMKAHVSAVFNTVQIPPIIKAKYRIKDNSEGKTATPFKSSLRVNPQASSCGGLVTVACLNSIYHISNNTGSAQLSQSVFETADQYFSQQDLNAFQSLYSLPQQDALYPYGYETALCATDGSTPDCNEGNLDLQYMMGIAQQTTTIYWYTPDSADPFLDWITDVADEAHPPQANSISWGAIESQYSTSGMTAFNTEAMKLANMGVTITVASGDDGAPNARSNGQCLCNSYNPSFPATSPYVTAVGATMGPESGNPEVACQSNGGGVITSGGGFSNFFAAGSWQTDAVNTYFAGLSTAETPISGYHRSGRAYPDISLIGVDYQVVIADQIFNIFGTSASAPVFAAFVSLVNAARLDMGKPSIGFLNPTLYSIGTNASSPYKFNDVVSGDNKCCAYSGRNPSLATCCLSGFTATAGWDPVTGWGSINFDTFAAAFEVAAPYSVTIPDDSLIPSVLVIVVLVLLLIALGFGVYFACWWYRQRRSQGGALHSAAYCHPGGPTVVDAPFHDNPSGTHVQVVQSSDNRGLMVNPVRVQGR